jgi:hypothetical protein
MRGLGQTLDAGRTARDRVGDDVVPGLPGCHFDQQLAVLLAPLPAARAHAQDQAGKALVGNHQVRAAAEDEVGILAMPRAQPNAEARSEASLTSAKHRAGPPNLKVVRGARGTDRSMLRVRDTLVAGYTV